MGTTMWLLNPWSVQSNLSKFLCHRILNVVRDKALRMSKTFRLIHAVSLSRIFLVRILLSRRPSLKRLHQSTNVLLHFNLIHLQRNNLIRNISQRRQMPSFRVRPMLVVVFHELIDDVIEMPLAEQDELVEAFMFDRLDEPLNPSVQIG